MTRLRHADAPATLSRGRFCALLPTALLAACAGTRPQAPRLSLVDLTVEAPDALAPRVIATLRILNPNPEPLAIEGYALDLSFAGERVASAVSADATTLAALSETVVDAAFVMSSLGWLKGLRAAAGGADLEAAVEGFVYVGTMLGRIRLPLRETARLD